AYRETLEQRARQRAPGSGDGGIVGSGDEEQRQQVFASLLAVITGATADQVDQPPVRLLGLAGQQLDVGRQRRGRPVVACAGGGRQYRSRFEAQGPPQQRDLGQAGLGLGVGGRLGQDLLVRPLRTVEVAARQRLVGGRVPGVLG